MSSKTINQLPRLGKFFDPTQHAVLFHENNGVARAMRVDSLHKKATSAITFFELPSIIDLSSSENYHGKNHNIDVSSKVPAFAKVVIVSFLFDGQGKSTIQTTIYTDSSLLNTWPLHVSQTDDKWGSSPSNLHSVPLNTILPVNQGTVNFRIVAQDRAQGAASLSTCQLTIHGFM